MFIFVVSGVVVRTSTDDRERKHKAENNHKKRFMRFSEIADVHDRTRFFYLISREITSYKELPIYIKEIWGTT